MKNKGFALVETLVATTVILGALVFLYIQFSTIKRAYENSFSYNTIPGLYSSKTLADFLVTNGYSKIDSELNKKTVGYEQITSSKCSIYYDSGTTIDLCRKLIENLQTRQILYVNNNITSLQNDLKSGNYDKNIFNDSFKKFVLQLESIEQKKRLLIEFKDNTYAVVLLDNA